jgi:hypothetical protein
MVRWLSCTEHFVKLVNGESRSATLADRFASMALIVTMNSITDKLAAWTDATSGDRPHSQTDLMRHWVYFRRGQMKAGHIRQGKVAEVAILEHQGRQTTISGIHVRTERRTIELWQSLALIVYLD